MAKDPPDRLERELDPRQREILKSVIQAHVLTGEPVGSRTLSKGPLDLSPATIRNVMADLEEQGFLTQPHASSGRIPTDRAYRLFVDRLMAKPRVAIEQAQAIDEALGKSRGEIPELLAEAARLLSHFSRQVGVVLVPELGRTIVERIEFIGIEGGRIVVILVDRAGVVHNRLLDVDEPIEQRDLDRFGRQLTDEFAGKTIPAMRESLLRRMLEERAQVDRMLARCLDLGRRAVDSVPDGSEVLVEGASNLLGAPEFAENLHRSRRLLRTLEERTRLVGLLGQILEGDGTQVVIGHENPVSELEDLSVVAATYHSGSRAMGSVGIVGPMRMEYARTIALVDHLARAITRFLSAPGN